MLNQFIAQLLRSRLGQVQGGMRQGMPPQSATQRSQLDPRLAQYIAQMRSQGMPQQPASQIGYRSPTMPPQQIDPRMNPMQRPGMMTNFRRAIT